SNLHAFVCARHATWVRLLERLGVELPVVQAGMGGGIARGDLAAAVSEAGGLGTAGILHPPAMRAELARPPVRPGRPARSTCCSRSLGADTGTSHARRTHS